MNKTVINETTNNKDMSDKTNNDAEFCSNYTPNDYDQMLFSLDPVIFTIKEGVLNVLLVQRQSDPAHSTDHPHQNHTDDQLPEHQPKMAVSRAYRDFGKRLRNAPARAHQHQKRGVRQDFAACHGVLDCKVPPVRTGWMRVARPVRSSVST